MPEVRDYKVPEQALIDEFSEDIARTLKTRREFIHAICPGEHKLELHLDGSMAWCSACGRDASGKKVGKPSADRKADVVSPKVVGPQMVRSHEDIQKWCMTCHKMTRWIVHYIYQEDRPVIADFDCVGCGTCITTEQ